MANADIKDDDIVIIPPNAAVFAAQPGRVYMTQQTFNQIYGPKAAKKRDAKEGDKAYRRYLGEEIGVNRVSTSFPAQINPEGVPMDLQSIVRDKEGQIEYALYEANAAAFGGLDPMTGKPLASPDVKPVRVYL